MSAQKGTASTRLLSMKFMQRAAAADSQISTPSTPDGPPTKRVRLSNGTSTPATPVLSDQQRLRAAQTEEALQRSAVIERLAAESGETRWILNAKEPVVKKMPLNIVLAGFADLDSADEENTDEETDKPTSSLVAGRMVFGQIQKSQATAHNNQESSEPDSESESGSDRDAENSEDSEQDPIDKLVQDATRRNREAAKAKKQAQKQEQQRLAALRRKKGVNLNSPSSTPENEVNLSALRSISGGMTYSGSKLKGNSHRPPPSRR